MTTRIKCDFKVTGWDQQPYDEPEKGAKLLRTEVKKVFSGEIEAESSAILLMCQTEDNSGAGYVASERVTGRVGERRGSFVIQHGGSLLNGQPLDIFGYIVPGSGTDELRGLRGHCSFYHDEHGSTFTLDYEIA